MALLPFNSPKIGEKVVRIKDGVEVEIKGYNSSVGIEGIFKVFDVETNQIIYLFLHEFTRS